MKKERLTIEDRILIEELVKLNYKLKEIANIIGVHSSSISRELKNRSISKNRNNICEKTNKYPFICFNCSKKVHCNKNRFYYNYKVAQKDYENKLRNSRIGIDMSVDEIEYWNDYFRDKIKIKINRFFIYLKILKMNFQNQFILFINMFIKVILQALTMKCLLDLLVINLEIKKK